MTANLERQLFRAGAAYPFLRQPLERVERVTDGDVRGLGTDGAAIYYDPNASPPPGAAEHMLLHCIFRHLLVPENAVRPLWDLACDLAAEYLRGDFFPTGESRLNQRVIADALPEQTDPRVAAQVYRALLDRFEDELEPLYGRFQLDDHRYWYLPHPDLNRRDAASPGRGQTYAVWKEEALAGLWPSENDLPGGLAATGRYGLAPGSRAEKLLLREAGKYDFTRYLRRFSTTREELRLDLAGFDYIPYCYGLERYGNLPLIEPLEYAETRKVEELVIAIDTSGSCPLPLVARFMSEIERILMRGDFFKRMNVRVMQCDAVVQSDTAIHSLEDWNTYTQNLVVKGRSGTDFRPVFKRVEALIKAGELKRLKGLLYFTDGDGAYPQQKPPYETAFVFSTKKALQYKKPDWIVPLCLERTTTFNHGRGIEN